jgi:hypothetical protein
MAHAERRRSPELDEVRKLLFPNLVPEDGWARIDAAFAGAADERRMNAIEALVREEAGWSEELLSG